EQHTDAPAAALRMRDRLPEPLLQQQTVGQAGERVARGQILELRLGLDTRRNILNERQYGNDATLVIEQARVVPLARYRLAVLAVVAIETGGSRLLARHKLVDQIDHRRPVGLMRELPAGDRHPEHFLGAPSENVSCLRR